MTEAASPARSTVPVDPAAKLVEVVRAGLIGDGAERSDPDAVLPRNSHYSGFGIVSGRWITSEFCVTAGDVLDVKRSDIAEHRNNVVS